MSIGKIVQVIGAVVDIEFPRDEMPKFTTHSFLKRTKTTSWLKKA